MVLPVDKTEIQTGSRNDNKSGAREIGGKHFPPSLSQWHSGNFWSRSHICKYLHFYACRPLERVQSNCIRTHTDTWRTLCVCVCVCNGVRTRYPSALPPLPQFSSPLPTLALPAALVWPTFKWTLNSRGQQNAGLRVKTTGWCSPGNRIDGASASQRFH